MKYKILVAYNGEPFVGWQLQLTGPSIQGKIEEALFCLLKEKIRVIGSGRTDSGVHALGQVAHFITEKEMGPYACYQLNALLPKEIRILSMEVVPFHFHAQKSAKRKIYHYHLWLDPVVDPFSAPFRLHIRGKFDLKRMGEAAPLFVGTHDFASFANAGTHPKNTIRTLYRLDIVPQVGGVRLEFEGNGFLYKMVRNIVGLLIEVGKGKREIADVPTLIEAKDRRLSASAAPPQALFLMQVHYPDSTSDEKEVCES